LSWRRRLQVAGKLDIIAHCRTLLARFKCPKTVIFAEIPKTSTGKIQKFKLRELARQLRAG
jgi:fatty-acyl-CoA synthase